MWDVTPCILMYTYRPFVEFGAGVATHYGLDGSGFEPLLVP
jgi:hypothetical protein